MKLPFTPEQFFGVFRAYNETVWPAQVALLALAVGALLLVAFPRRWSGRGVSAILAFLWAWLGLAYHFAFFATINPLAYAFAAVSVLGSLVFVWQGVVQGKLEFRLVPDARGVLGVVMVVFAIVVYPAWSVYAGHGYPAMPTFGLPCPTTLFTMGVLAFLVVPYPRAVFAVPVLWCLVGVQAAFLLGVWQDLGLLVAAAVGIVLIARPGQKFSALSPGHPGVTPLKEGNRLD
jgi:hypothetical protein